VEFLIEGDKMVEMHFYWWHKSNMIVVQNVIMGNLGQKHEHTEEDFKEWSKDIPVHCLHELKTERTDDEQRDKKTDG